MNEYADERMNESKVIKDYEARKRCQSLSRYAKIASLLPPLLKHSYNGSA